jgi:hypothetical protein
MAAIRDGSLGSLNMQSYENGTLGNLNSASYRDGSLGCGCGVSGLGESEGAKTGTLLALAGAALVGLYLVTEKKLLKANRRRPVRRRRRRSSRRRR